MSFVKAVLVSVELRTRLFTNIEEIPVQGEIQSSRKTCSDGEGGGCLLPNVVAKTPILQ